MEFVQTVGLEHKKQRNKRTKGVGLCWGIAYTEWEAPASNMINLQNEISISRFLSPFATVFAR
jgi:hypothetical protein